MLPVITRPPKRPGAWGSPFGKPMEIDLSHHPDPRCRPHERSGEGLYVLPNSGWYVQCGSGNRVHLVYILEEREVHHPEPWQAALAMFRDFRPPNWAHLPRPPRPDEDDVRSMELIAPGKAGSVFADGQNVVIEGRGKAIIIQVFSV